MSQLKFILSGGGTGGHIYPAIAIADELKKRHPDAEILFVGAKGRMEMEKIPQAGYTIEGLWISGLQRSLSLSNLSFPFKVIKSIFQSRKILNRFKPDAVIGTGGFASGPLLYAAASKKIPTLIQEQNSYPGITNKILSKKVNVICVAYENMERYFPKSKLLLTGNPLRSDLTGVMLKNKTAVTHFGLDSNKIIVLVLGGSLGARNINILIENNREYFIQKDIQVIWQTGKYYFNNYKKYDRETIRVVPFINRMDLAYQAADIIVSRSGALSVSELSLVGKSVVFIPSPNVAEDHQTKNAKAIASQDAAILLEEKQAEKDFKSILSSLLESESERNLLGKAIKKLARPDAAQRIVDEIEKLIKKA
ncbi:MAG: undecaprenyldiphospho-muramoylpentapeptide beta-N-acetylglucosaminyltransferase [Flavobacteriaceae bacterium]|nr:undecaprenyldiphospho-muramoylpentapeptide beta-N-acetylglucosaminyltransferase [Flavobacteriaceae bacterium]MDZ4148245.1 undecaprenyldiphospho-muramoylpentapeptide beta-N-acetylglucosaminyltransferase [Flavobacteriaceae bacterium]